MGRHKKIVEISDQKICPVCKNSFCFSEKEYFYFLSDGPTCSWKCFLEYVRNHKTESKRQTQEKQKVIFESKSFEEFVFIPSFKGSKDDLEASEIIKKIKSGKI